MQDDDARDYRHDHRAQVEIDRLRARVRDLETFAISREWTPHDEQRDYCLACGGVRPEPEDSPPTIGHIRGCPAAALLSFCGRFNGS